MSILKKKTKKIKEVVKKETKMPSFSSIKNRALYDVLKKAEESDGYLVCISYLKGDGLKHHNFTSKFKNEDIYPSLDEQAKLLEPQTKVTDTK